MLRTDLNEDHQPTPLSLLLRNHFGWDNQAAVASVEAEAEYIGLSSGDTLIRQGEAGDDVYFVLSGRLRAQAVTSEGETKILGEVGRGESIGELALLTGATRSASVVALRNACVARVSRQVVDRCIAREPQVARSLTRLVVERLRQRATTRPRGTVPVNVCFLPISGGVDARDFAEALKARQPRELGAVAVLGSDEAAAGPGGGVSRSPQAQNGAFNRYLDEVEQKNSAVYLVADYENSAWTRLCLENADEIVLLAHAAADPGRSEVETRLLSLEAPITMARQTLVLLHPVADKSPRGTARWLSARGRPRHFHIRPALESDMARMARIISGRAVGLVFAGGGARGFAHIGVYQALEQTGVEIDYVGGTSIGALMGTMVALDVRGAELERYVREAFLEYPKGSVTGDYNVLPMLSLIKGGRSRDSLAMAIRRHAGSEIDVEDTWKSLFVMASNFSTGNEQVLSTGSLVGNVTASFAIPGILPPVLMDGHLLFDGGTFNNFPVDVMAGMGAGKVIGVDLSAGDFGKRLELDRIPGTLELLFDRLRPRARQRYRRLPSMPETMIFSSFVTSLARQREQRHHADLLFRPDLPRIGLLDWHRFEQIVAAGRVHAADILSQMSAESLSAYR